LACDSIAPAPDLQRIILTQLDRLPYWLVFWASVTTIISGYLYIPKVRRPAPARIRDIKSPSRQGRMDRVKPVAASRPAGPDVAVGRIGVRVIFELSAGRLVSNQALYGRRVCRNVLGVFLLRWLPLDMGRKSPSGWEGGDRRRHLRYRGGQMGRVDDPRMVIDECVGYWTTLLFSSSDALYDRGGFCSVQNSGRLQTSLGPTVGRPFRRVGVVMDDILAGVVANGLLHGLRLLYPH